MLACAVAIRFRANWSRIALAFEVLTPPEACEHFSRGLQRPVRYVNAPCEIKIPIPDGYRDQLEAIVETLCDNKAVYFRPDMECPETARQLWPGWRGLEEYARETWPLEEKQNGAQWAEGLSGLVTPAEELEQGLEVRATSFSPPPARGLASADSSSLLRDWPITIKDKAKPQITRAHVTLVCGQARTAWGDA